MVRKNSFVAEYRPYVMVASHERSGTHFLMNALAACYGYDSSPWINLDNTSFPINYRNPAELRRFLFTQAIKPHRSIVKSHHPADFFGSELPAITGRFVVFYIYRDPVAVMLSCWRIMHRWGWDEGPKVADPLTYARAQPSGAMVRYQLHCYPNILLRWAAHVESWLAAAQAIPGVVLVRYEDLDTRYGETVRGFIRKLGFPPGPIIRPSRDTNIIPGGPEDPAGLGIPPDIGALRTLCRETVGGTMARLGYWDGKVEGGHDAVSPGPAVPDSDPGAPGSPSGARLANGKAHAGDARMVTKRGHS